MNIDDNMSHLFGLHLFDSIGRGDRFDSEGNYLMFCSNENCLGKRRMTLSEERGEVQHYVYKERNISMRDPIFICDKCGSHARDGYYYEAAKCDLLEDIYAREVEGELVKLSSDMYNLYMSLNPTHPLDQQEFTNAINDIQKMLMARVARRARPDLFPSKGKE